MLYLFLFALLAQPSGAMGAPELEARLIADQDGVRAGTEVTLALELKLEPPWHMYDPIVLDTGMPTTITIEAPSGAVVGPWRFPRPSLGEQFNLEYLEHSGAFYCLSSLKLDPVATAEDQPLKLKVTVKGLACIEERCVPVKASAVLELPITDSPRPANQELFEKARRKLPHDIADAEYISKTRSLTRHRQVPVGGESEIVAVVRVDPGHHVQDRNPLSEDFVPTRLFIEGVEGLLMKPGEQIWPEPHVRDLPYVGKVREQTGTFLIRQPFRITDPKFQPRKLKLRTLIQYQVCTDAGQCYAPELARGEVEFEVVAAGAATGTDVEVEKLIATQKPASRNPVPAQAVLDVVSGAGFTSLLWVYVFAFLGGALLNIMPCVLPVVSLKIFSFVSQAHESRGRILALGLTYAAGLLCSFLPLAILIAWGGASWGSLLQSPVFVIAMISFVFAFSLSLLGLFEIQLPGSVQSAAAHAGAREGFGGAFLNGVFATALATPCVGPMLASSLGVLASLPPWPAASGIMLVGVGMALPYVLLTAFPQWLRALPRPGAWMNTFKQVLGFIMLLAVLWLLWVLRHQVDEYRFFATIGLLLFVAAGCWQLGRLGLVADWGQTLRGWSAAAVTVAVGWFACTWWFQPSAHSLEWRRWEPGIGPRLASQGHTVYIDYTAEWCTTCKQNKGAVLHTQRIADKISALRVVAIEADFTSQDEQMQAELRDMHRNGVPLNVIYPANKPGEPIVLPALLTQAIVVEALDRAGPSVTKSSSDLPPVVAAGVVRDR